MTTANTTVSGWSAISPSIMNYLCSFVDDTKLLFRMTTVCKNWKASINSLTPEERNLAKRLKCSLDDFPTRLQKAMWAIHRTEELFQTLAIVNGRACIYFNPSGFRFNTVEERYAGRDFKYRNNELVGGYINLTNTTGSNGLTNKMIPDPVHGTPIHVKCETRWGRYLFISNAVGEISAINLSTRKLFLIKQPHISRLPRPMKVYGSTLVYVDQFRSHDFHTSTEARLMALSLDKLNIK